MALIRCEEFGREISDRAAACPHCGCPLDQQIKSGEIHFYWVGKPGDSIHTTTVFIDGDEVGSMRCGDYLDCTVNSGEHLIELMQKRHLLAEEIIFIDNDNPEEFYAYKEVMGFSHARVKRLDKPQSWVSPTRSIPRCPTCGSEKIKKLSMERRIFSVGMLGFASNTIGKTFVCKKCGYKW